MPHMGPLIQVSWDMLVMVGDGDELMQDTKLKVE